MKSHIIDVGHRSSSETKRCAARGFFLMSKHEKLAIIFEKYYEQVQEFEHPEHYKRGLELGERRLLEEARLLGDL